MPTATIRKRYTLEAAHHLPNHDGKCRRPHGHSYVVEVELCGPLIDAGSSEGMVTDFADVSAVFKRRVHERLDHQDLNVVLADEVPVTTAEWLAWWILREMLIELPHTAAVRVHETESAWAEARA